MSHGVKTILLALTLPVFGCSGSDANIPPPPPPPTPPVVQPAPAPAPPQPVAAGPTPPEITPPPAQPLSAGATDPRDAAIGAYARDVTQALIHAAKGEAVDARWIAHHPAHAVTALSAEGHGAMRVLGNNLEVLATEVELDAVAQPAAGQHHQIAARAIVLPDGTVRWGTAAHRTDESELLQPTPRLDTTAPALVGGVARVVEALRGPCALPWLTDGEVQGLPAHIRHEILPEPGSTHTACTRAAAVHGEWRPHVDDVRVFVRGNNHIGILRSIFDVEGHEADGGTPRLVLSPLHIEVVPE